MKAFDFCGAAAVALATAFGTFAAEGRVTYTYLGGDVTSSASYDPNGTPAEGDWVLVTADAELSITNGTAGWTAMSALGASGQIVPTSPASRVVLTVPEAGASVEFDVPVGGWEYREYFKDIDINGTLVKRGAGELTLTATRQSYSDYNVSYSVRTLACEEGTLSFGLANVKSQIRLVRIEVAKGATLNLGARPSASCTTYSQGGLFGAGTVSTKSSYTCALLIGGNSSSPGRFYGRLTGNVKWGVPENGAQFVLSNDSDYNVEQTLYYGYHGVSSLGETGSASSFGKHKYLWFVSAGSYVEYFGGGETVTKQVVLGHPAGALPVTLSAGPTGGVQFASFIYPSSTSSYPPHVRLDGSNRLEAAVSGTIQENAAGNSVYFTKVGSGAWRFKNAAGRRNANGLAVREGRLIFDSIAETNAFCSLGVATNLFDGSHAEGWTAAEHRTDIFLTLGSTTGRAAIFEFGGTNSQTCTTRKIGLDGEGGHFRNDNPETQIRWVGARALGGTPVLTLDGASTKTNELADISDGAVPLAVCKDGTGTWKISGDTTFTGPLTVLAGRLIVAAPVTNRYSWFRWTMRNHKDTGLSFYVEEFGLYGADNRRVNDTLVRGANGWGELAPGELALQWPCGVVYTYEKGRGPEDDGWETERGLVDRKRNYGFSITPKEFGSSVYQVAGRPTTYLPVVLRLDPKAFDEVASWDYANLYSSGNGSSVWSSLLEGSVDGLHWEYLDENTELDSTALTKSWMWSFAKRSIDDSIDGVLHAVHTGGRAIAGHSSRTYSVLSGKPEVSVAAGAVLEAEGEVVVSKLKVDAAGAGTLRGVTLAETGTLEVTGSLEGKRSVKLPLALDGVKGSANLESGWSLTVNRAPDARWRIRVAGGAVTLRKSGLVIFFR